MPASPPPGLSPDEISELQGTLKDVGFDPGPPNGRLESRTERALAEFQAKNGLPADGVPGPETLAALRTAKAQADARKSMPVDRKRRARPPVEKRAEPPPPESDNVSQTTRKVQEQLRAMGFYDGEPTGRMNRKTTEAIRRFQAANDLPADGFPGSLTLSLLERLSSEPVEKPAEVGEPVTPDGRSICVISRASDSSALAALDRALGDRVTYADSRTAAAILILLSPASVELRFDDEPDVQIALRRARAGEARLFPVVLEPVVWADTPFAEFQAVAGGRPLSELDDLEPVAAEILAALGGGAAPRSYLPGFASESMEGADLLARRERIEFLASLLAAKQLETPLAIGLFGDWGSGKSFFMRRLQERVVEITEASAAAQAAGEKSLYCSHVRHVTFNAWLFADSAIWPAFAAEVFRGVAGLETEAPQGERHAEDLAHYQADLRVRRERIRELRTELADTERQLDALGDDLGGGGQALRTGREVVRRLASVRTGWRDLRLADGLLVAAVVLAALSFSVLQARWTWIAAAVSGGLSVLRYVTDRGRLRTSRDRLRTELAAEQAASPAETVAEELPLLPEYAAQQAAEWADRTQLGVVTEIRMNFARLSDLIGKGVEARKAGAVTSAEAVPLERVIVYVDDLDRCHHDVVVGVLETLKLLLSLPHFVVVVGVDSRWLFRSLELHFRELLRSDDGSADSVWAATPQNYLEKIFQYSVVLRPIGTAGFERLIEHVLGPGAEPEPELPAGPGAVPAPDDSAPVADAGDDEAAAPGEAHAEAANELDLVPAELVISRAEITFMKGLAPMFETPRAAKRLANVYRLLRVSVGAGRLLHGEAYEPVLLLLSIGIGFPGLAPDVLRAIERNRELTWRAFLDELRNVARPDDAPWLRLISALGRSAPGAVADRSLATFVPWIETVAEFSFHPWQELLPSETQA